MVDEVKATPPAPPRALEEGASIRRISYSFAVDEESAHLCAGFFSFFFLPEVSQQSGIEGKIPRGFGAEM